MTSATTGKVSSAQDAGNDTVGERAFAVSGGSLSPAVLIRQTTYALWGSVLCGSQTARQKAIYRRMKEPRIGDWVVEVTNWWTPDENAVGRLEKIEQREVGEEDDKWTDTYWIIRRLDGTTIEWTNCSFIPCIAGMPGILTDSGKQ